MNSLSGMDVEHLVAVHGYWAVFLVVGLESMGMPLPGETVLIAAAAYAGTTHGLDIAGVIAAAAAGAILGDNAGFCLGRRYGFTLLMRHGGRIGLDEPRLKLGQYLFLRHGGKIVFFGRFVALLRVLAAALAGANRMSWPRFLLANAIGGVVWAIVFGTGGYAFGTAVHRLSGPAGIALAAAAVAAAVAGTLFVRRHEAHLRDKAERALPGPLCHHPALAAGQPAGSDG